MEVRSLIERRPWSILSWASGIIALTFIGYYAIIALGSPSPTIGQPFVISEFPDPRFSPYFSAKPITWFSYASFLYWAFGLEAQKSHFLNLSARTRRFLFIVAALIGFGALYEIFFNFMLWSALEVLATNCPQVPCSPDYLAYQFSNIGNPLNLVFDTKVVVLVFGLSMYSLYYLHRVDKEAERRNSSPNVRFARQEAYDVGTIKNVPMTRAYSFEVTTGGQEAREYGPST